MHQDPGPAEPTASASPSADPVVTLTDGPDEGGSPLARVPGGEPAPFGADLGESLPPVASPLAAAPDPLAAALAAPDPLAAAPPFAAPEPSGSPYAAAPASPHDDHGHPSPAEAASIRFLVVVTVVSLAADLVTKGWAKARLAGFDTKLHGVKRLPVWKDHLDFVFAQNPGGAWSFLRGLPDGLRRPFFLVVSAAAIVFIVSIYRRVHRDQTSMRWGLPLALGGAMGNLVDRVRYGWVVDFIDFSMKWGGREHHWPTFNVADIAIVVGVALMGIDMARTRRFHHGEGHGHPVSPPA
jgi:signal peptidase II